MQNKISSFIKRRYALVLGVAVIVLLVAVVVVANVKSAKLVIQVAPSGATIKIGGRDYGNETIEGMWPGHYTAMISKDGFESKIVEFDLRSHETTILSEYLLGLEGGLGVYEFSADDLYWLRQYADANENEAVSEFISEHDKRKTIKDVLPLYDIDKGTGNSYYVFYKEGADECQRIYCLEIGANTRSYTGGALQGVRAHGYNPEDYEIIYKIDDET